MKDIVTIKATPKLQNLAQLTVDIQDACNMAAVANHLVQVLNYFGQGLSDGQLCTGSEFASQNPVTISVINKLEHLSGLVQSKPMAFIGCINLAQGEDVEWEIEFSD